MVVAEVITVVLVVLDCLLSIEVVVFVVGLPFDSRLICESIGLFTQKPIGTLVSPVVVLTRL